MVAWWWLLVAFALGTAVGIALVVLPFWIGQCREFREHEADIKRRNAELDKRIRGGCRQAVETLPEGWPSTYPAPTDLAPGDRKG